MRPQKFKEQRNSRKDEELSLSNIEKEKKQSWEMVHSMANTEVPGDLSPSTKSLRQMAYFPILKIKISRTTVAGRETMPVFVCP